ncbi:AbrB family transcriptional regulator [Oceanobacillus senegalensis]|uniref:AbrB family transcriptional regulator n=1 Tax=Oceanobacillus senegalensis TaxID=1936063 RepID=UPI0015C4573C|nr:AbrB family transcriptional regulator [Oceanobacillus senegalensis]
MKDRLKVLHAIFNKEILIVFFIAVIGANIFSFLHVPIPWMLGPIFSLLLFQFIYKGSLRWSPRLRDIGLVVLGLTIGQQFDLALFNNLGILLIYMFLLNIVLIAGSIGLAYLLSKWSKLSFKSMILSTIPGGIAQIVVFAEEEKDVDLAAITYFHVVRLLLVVVIVPFIVASQVATKPEVSSSLTIGLILLILVSWLVSLLAKRIHMPIAYFLTPVLIAIGLNLGSVTIPVVPPSIMNIALLCIGAHIGLALKPHMIKLPKRYLLAGVFSSIGLIALTFGTSFVLSIMLGFSFATSFLSTAPGGLDQMVLLADAIGADVSMVTVFQIFRLLFIFLIVMPALKFFYKNTAQKKIIAPTVKNQA